MTFPCIKYKIHKYTNTQIHKYANTKCLKDPTCAILFKSIGFKDIKYDIPVYQIYNTQIHKYANMQIHKYKVIKRPNKDIKYDNPVYQM